MFPRQDWSSIEFETLDVGEWTTGYHRFGVYLTLTPGRHVDRSAQGST
jgi:hypothetical protein